MQISVIIPTYNEAQHIVSTIESLRLAGHSDEIIIADGGSSDQTLALVNGIHNVIGIETGQKGRGAQMAAGARKAKGKFLFFLHADTTIQRNGYTYMIWRLMAQDSPKAGCFYLKFNNTKPVYRRLSFWSRINSRYTTYGDQGLVMARTLYDDIGGYKALPIMEDVDILSRIRKKSKLEKFPYALTTDARRFERNGVWKQMIINTILLTLYFVGVSPKRLSNYYPAHSSDI